MSHFVIERTNKEIMERLSVYWNRPLTKITFNELNSRFIEIHSFYKKEKELNPNFKGISKEAFAELRLIENALGGTPKSRIESNCSECSHHSVCEFAKFRLKDYCQFYNREDI